MAKTKLNNSDNNSTQHPILKPKLKKIKKKTLPSSPPATAATTTTTTTVITTITPLSSPPRTPHTDSATASDFQFDSDSVDVATLLEPFTKDQLIELLSIAASQNSSLYSLINQHANRDSSHRKVFIHGFNRDTTREDLVSAFESFGEIEDCNVVTDKVTGKAKGYGFVLFKTRKGAAMALMDPKKKINNRIANCQLASIGAPINLGKEQESGGRKIYVSNVPANVDTEKLKAFFAKFGEIEAGPMGFDKQTGKSRGYALFIYKTVEGAMGTLEEPHKLFEGHQLHCSIAMDTKNKTNQGQLQKQQHINVNVNQPSQGQMLAAVAAAQNLGLFGQQPGLNPVYSGLFSNPGAPAGIISPIMAGAMSQGLGSMSQVGGLGVATQSAPGTYGTVQGYPNAHTGHRPIGSFPRYSSYL
ncbi:UBP1-associated protein 2B-like isoform X2 [Euphorbia lathyris]|uniref:UBP1-associated protein 2B-like isoform X1 n=1 Tax=Euphorbia lathyris TaxID=212925 RepID=UPI0033141108